jgi:conjugal transfer pilus assembly protein TraW
MKSMILLLTIFMVPGFAKHLGTFGQTFTILEPDLLAEIQIKLANMVKSGEMLEHQIKIQNMMRAEINRPVPVAGLIKTKESKVFWYNPSIQVPYDLSDHQNRIFATFGTIVDPLDHHKFRKPLLFIDGDDVKQVAWANNSSQHCKIILVNGSPFEFIERHKTTCYFDQGGRLIKKFGIKQVPAKVSQDGKLLKIEEVLLDE